ncbi:hypothetical protein SASPL_155595 [Salvia splendens]|uniref:Uncharacterized protein n=1 Tax=Salvia splendens TaxID=180675 RepID=A0A8X8VYA7_SALSN|nr:hypothetical protein SASPL_155595 [Salvia splendens]
MELALSIISAISVGIVVKLLNRAYLRPKELEKALATNLDKSATCFDTILNGQAREVLNKSNSFPKPQSSNPLPKMLVQGVVSYEGEKWAKHRKISNSAFHLDKLKLMIPAFVLSCEEIVSEWEKSATSRTALSRSYRQGRRIFELQREQADYAMKAMRSIYIPGWSKSFGITMDDVVEESKLFYFAVQEMTKQTSGMADEGEGREVLRVYSPIVALRRQVGKETKLGEATLPAGVHLTVPVILLHHDREVWGDDATEFNPERGSGEGAEEEASCVFAVRVGASHLHRPEW